MQSLSVLYLCTSCHPQTYLEQNEGAGLQHLALKTNNIIHTVGEMAKRSQYGGFEFMPRPSESYYGKVAQKVVSAAGSWTYPTYWLADHEWIPVMA